MLQVDLRRRDADAARGDPTDRDPEDRDLRQDLRRGREGQADQQVGQDPGEQRRHPSGRKNYAGAPGHYFMINFTKCLVQTTGHS